MKQLYFITATNTDIGKTYSCEIFLKKLAKENKKVGYLKPIETGVVDKPSDGTKLLDLVKILNTDFNFTIDDVVPYQFKLPASPFVAKGDKDIDIDLIIKKAKTLLLKCDVLVVEGAGGLMVPINKNYFIIDLIKDFQKNFNLKTILISPSNLGSINDTILSQKMLEYYDINFLWYVNLFKDKESFEKITLPFYKKHFKNINFLQDIE